MQRCPAKMGQQEKDGSGHVSKTDQWKRFQSFLRKVKISSMVSSPRSVLGRAAPFSNVLLYLYSYCLTLYSFLRGESETEKGVRRKGLGGPDWFLHVFAQT